MDIIYAIIIIVLCIKMYSIRKINEKEINSIIKSKDTYLLYYQILNLWIKLNNQGKNLSQYLIQNNYKKVAIYGVGEIGVRLFEHLKNSDVKVCFCVDQYMNKDKVNNIVDVEIIKLDSIKDAEAVDAIIVTPINYYEKIETDLLKTGIDFEILSLEEIVACS